jgi:hypothetical protein
LPRSWSSTEGVAIKAVCRSLRGLPKTKAARAYFAASSDKAEAELKLIELVKSAAWKEWVDSGLGAHPLAVATGSYLLVATPHPDPELDALCPGDVSMWDLSIAPRPESLDPRRPGVVILADPDDQPDPEPADVGPISDKDPL